jgi:hypothetical protein
LPMNGKLPDLCIRPVHLIEFLAHQICHKRFAGTNNSDGVIRVITSLRSATTCGESSALLYQIHSRNLMFRQSTRPELSRPQLLQRLTRRHHHCSRAHLGAEIATTHAHGPMMTRFSWTDDDPVSVIHTISNFRGIVTIGAMPLAASSLNTA